MKKMFTVALLFLFIIGITDIAIAQSTDQSDTDNSGNIRDKISKDAIEKRGKQLLKTANNRLNIIEKLDREEKKINNIENKLQKKEKEIEQKRLFVEKKKEMMEKKHEFIQNKNDVKRMKEKLMSSCNDNNQNENCADSKKELKRNAKPYLINSIETMIKITENLKTSVENSDLEGKNMIIEKINNKIAKLNDLKTRVDNTDESASEEEIKAVAKEIKEEWNKFKRELKLNSQRIINKKMTGILERAGKLETRLDRMLTKLNSQGYDTSTLEPMIRKFKENVRLARDNYDKAKIKYMEADISSANYISLIKEARQFVVLAHNNLQDAQLNLKDITTELRKRNNPEALKDISETESEEEIEDTIPTTTLQETTTTVQLSDNN